MWGRPMASIKEQAGKLRLDIAEVAAAMGKRTTLGKRAVVKGEAEIPQPGQREVNLERPWPEAEVDGSAARQGLEARRLQDREDSLWLRLVFRLQIARQMPGGLHAFMQDIHDDDLLIA